MDMLMKFVPVIIILAICLIVIPMVYVKAPPNEAYIISGISKRPRVLIGKAGFKIPFLERVDRMLIGQIDVDIMTEDYIPTKDFINIKVDAIAQVAINTSTAPMKLDLSDGTTEETTGMQIAMKNFLGKSQDQIRNTIVKSLQGNLREIIGTMVLQDICQDKASFSNEVKSNAEADMARLGITILSFNVQNIQDKDDLISDLGIDNREQIRKKASIAKADALKEVEIAEAKANDEANQARVQADEAIAMRNNALAIKKANLQEEEDRARAVAEIAGEIQSQTERKKLEIETQMAEIARREKEIELQAKEAEVAEKKLDAEVRKKAEAEKYAKQQAADANLYERQKLAEADLFEKEKEAEAIRKTGEAEAEAIKAKGLAEAEALEKKADAMKKYGDAAKLEMLVNILPEMAKAIAEPITAIKDVRIIGGNTEGVSDMANNVPLGLAKTIEAVKATTGFDLTEVMKAETIDAKVKREVDLTGVPTIEATIKSDKEFVED